MDFNRESAVYLTKISTAVLVLSNMIGCDIDSEKKRKALISMLELEQSTADFITEMNLSPASAKICKEGFIHANKTAMSYLQKIQSQGVNFDEFTNALKLENETLKEELASL